MLLLPPLRGETASWVASTLGASAEDRLSGDPTRIKLAKWALDDFQELVAEKLKSYEREIKELHLMLFPEVGGHVGLTLTGLVHPWPVSLLRKHCPFTCVSSSFPALPGALGEATAWHTWLALPSFDSHLCSISSSLSVPLSPGGAQVLQRIARFDRALSQPGGSLLLAGPSGCGRRSLALLLAYMHHLELYTPKMTR